MATKHLVTTAAVGLVLTLLLVVPAGAAQVLPPHNFFGTVIVNTLPVPDGTRVQARIDGNVCGETTTFTDGFGPGSYTGLAVVSSGEKPGCGDDGDTVEFWVKYDGLDFAKAPQTATWMTGGNTRLNLELRLPLRPVGGYGEPLSASELLAPWLVLITAVFAITVAAMSLRQRIALW
ncbi:MAG: hypothetical protein D6791_11295 [Chloroflexi bacterium]|nr:MAG: hypothetical protein D6791_11295 [Chloroflexota bacterium]